MFINLSGPKGMYISLDGWCLYYYSTSYIDNAIDILYNSLFVNCLFLAIAACEYTLQTYNSKIAVYKLSIIVLQTVRQPQSLSSFSFLHITKIAYNHSLQTADSSPLYMP
jgi:hypothetical protein